jgi:hypothetical protein
MDQLHFNSSPQFPIRFFVFVTLLVLSFTSPAKAGMFDIFAPTLNITANPLTANIYRLKTQDNSLISIGVGSAKITLDSDDPNTIVVKQEGFRDVQRSFPRDSDYKDKDFTIFLSTRIVQLTVLPYDADILVNGEAKGKKSLDVEVTEGQTTTVEVTKPGFVTSKRVYRWEKGGEMPATQERIELVDRKVMVTSSGGELFSNNTKIGDSDGEFIINRGTCGTIVARKPGRIPVEREWCNKDGLPPPPLNERIVLTGYTVNVTAPPTARILVNHKLAGLGSYLVQIPDGSCITMRVEQKTFINYDREYCAQPNTPIPPMDENVALKPDESYSASMASDQANVDVTIEPGKSYTEERAWKLLSSIVLSHFDVLENSDSQTGYLRSAWQFKSWGDNNEVVIRTRVIVKRSNDSPLRYSIKIVSERNKKAGVSMKEDENFEPWDRVLNTYKDVLNEVQSRMK